MDIELLKKMMEERHKTARDLTIALNISKSATYRKLNGKSEFTRQQINIIIELLELNKKMTYLIFFNHEVS